MGRFRVLFVSGATLSLSIGLLALSACGGRAPTGPPSYAITATALHPSSVTAGSPSTSDHHRDAGKRLYRQRQPFVQKHHWGNPGSHLFLQRFSSSDQRHLSGHFHDDDDHIE